MILALNLSTTKTYFRHYHVGIKTVCTTLYLSFAKERFSIVAHTYTASFSIQTRCNETNNIFYVRNNYIYIYIIYIYVYIYIYIYYIYIYIYILDLMYLIEICVVIQYINIITTFLLILLMSGVMAKKIILLKNEIGQYLQN